MFFFFVEDISSIVQFRLVGGQNSSMGRVEVLFAGVWGTICENSWSVSDAKVLCRQLGLPHGNARRQGNAEFGQGSGLIWLDNVACSGNESTLLECRHAGWGNNNCTHANDVSVVCTDGTSHIISSGIPYTTLLKKQTNYTIDFNILCMQS